MTRRAERTERVARYMTMPGPELDRLIAARKKLVRKEQRELFEMQTARRKQRKVSR